MYSCVSLRYDLVGPADRTLVPPSALVTKLMSLPLVPAGVVSVVQQLSAELSGIWARQLLVRGFVAAQLTIGPRR